MQIVEARNVVSTANEAVIVAREEYNDAKGYADDIDDFSNFEGLSKLIPEDELELITGEDQSGSVSYNSLVDYDDQLEC